MSLLSAYIPYSRQEIRQDDVDAVVAVLRSEFLTQGPAIERFEAAFSQRHKVAHAIAMANATDALHVACVALGAGPGDWVWTSPISFVASANCALYCGARVDFVDIDPLTRNMSIAALEDRLRAAEAEGRLPKIVIPVDFAGLPCELAQIRRLADRYGFKILEDASHATGATLDGQPVGGQYADASVFSFHAVKIVTTGEGGLLTTQDPEIAARVALLRSHGITRDPSAMSGPPEGGWYYEQTVLGYNYRMTDIQAALGSSQLARLDTMQDEREARADRYDRLLADLPLLLPARQPGSRSAWHLYTVQLTAGAKCDRGELFAHLRDAGIGVNVHYIPIHLQPYYRAMGFARGDFPQAEAYYDGALTLPLFPAMTDAQQDFVVARIAEKLR